MDNFYVTLISNNSSSKDNQPASFRTYLPYTLQLPGQWECALAELSFMRSWYNIDDIKDERIWARSDYKQTTIGYKIRPHPSKEFDSEIYKEYEFLEPYKLMGIFPNGNWRFFDIPGGHYTSIQDLMDNIQTGFEEDFKKFHQEVIDVRKKEMYKTTNDIGDRDEDAYLHEYKLDTWYGWITPLNGYSRMDDLEENGVKISHDKVKKRIVINVKNEYIEVVVLSKHLEFVLGLNPRPGLDGLTMDSSGTMLANYPVNLNAGANSLYVYADIVQPNIVSNTMARLLRIVNAEGEYGKHFTKAFTKPYYQPVSSSVINSIEIEIKDGMNRNIKFTFGVTIALLHFQRKKSINI